jgi:hypothetical protein
MWQQNPVNITNAADVAATDPPQYRARPTYDMPAAHSNTAAAAVCSIYRPCRRMVYSLPLFLANRIVFFNTIHWSVINRLPVLL